MVQDQRAVEEEEDTLGIISKDINQLIKQILHL